jgi:DNA invertase Pin-like site-specific DNA recombinase
MLAYSYVRFSSKKQAAGDSLRRQTEKTEAYCKANDLTLANDNFQDLGISGWTGKNVDDGALGAFLAAVKSGKIRKGSILVVENLDRISRDQINKALNVFCSILDAGISIVTLSPERTYQKSHLANPSTLIEAILGFVLANEESGKKSKRLLDKWAERRKKGASLGKNCPCWLVPEGNGYSLVPEKVKTVQMVFDLAKQGRGIFSILRHLNENKIKPISRGMKGKKASWNSVFVCNLLKNRAVLGERILMKIVDGERVPEKTIKGYFPAIVDEGDFLAIQSDLKRRDKANIFRGRGAKTSENLFAGMITDARDGGKIQYMKARKNGGKDAYPFLVAVNATNKTGNTCYVAFPYPQFEMRILFAVSGLKLSDLEDSQEVDSGAKRKALQGELDAIESNMSDIQAHILAGKRAGLYLSVIDQLEERKAAITNELEQLASMPIAAKQEALDDICELMDTIYAKPDFTIPADVRERLRCRLRALLVGIRVLFSRHKVDSGKTGYCYGKRALVEICYQGGSVQRFIFTYHDGEIACEFRQDGFDLGALPDGFACTDPEATI